MANVEGYTGNIDLNQRPVLKNPDGTWSTEQSFSVNIDGKEVLLPAVVGGKKLSQRDAVEYYKKTGKHLGIFDSIEEANRMSELIHNRFKPKKLNKQEYLKALFAKPRQPTEHEQKWIDYLTPYMNKAVKTAEGNPRNFGVLSQKVNSPEEANNILNESVRNNFIRWMQAGKPGKFIDFMRDRWAPLNAPNDPDKLNFNWAPNVRKSLKKQLGEDLYKKWEQLDLVKYFSPERMV